MDGLIGRKVGGWIGRQVEMDRWFGLTNVSVYCYTSGWIAGSLVERWIDEWMGYVNIFRKLRLRMFAILNHKRITGYSQEKSMH